jgi:L-rhamnose-H+ transport protein
MTLAGIAGAFILLIVSGVLNGSAALPLKFAKHSEWENLWLIQSIVGMAILPWVLVEITIPQLLNVYRACGVSSVAAVTAFGFGWGVGNVLYIVGVVMVGLSVSYAIILSLTATLGSLLPVLVLHPHALYSRQGHLLLAALAISIVGIVMCSRAGAGRTEESEGGNQRSGRSFRIGILVCILSGIFSPMLNFGFAFGHSVVDTARKFGASPTWAPNTVWAITFWASFGINAIYCLWHLGLRKSWSRFRDSPIENLVAGSIIAILLDAAIVLYGVGAEGLGAWGTSTGWAVNMCTTVFAANLWGLATGEWRNAARRSYLLLSGGLTAITVAIMFAALAA